MCISVYTHMLMPCKGSVVLSLHRLYHMGSEDWTQAIRLGEKCPDCPETSHLTGHQKIFLKSIISKQYQDDCCVPCPKIILRFPASNTRPAIQNAAYFCEIVRHVGLWKQFLWPYTSKQCRDDSCWTHRAHCKHSVFHAWWISRHLYQAAHRWLRTAALIPARASPEVDRPLLPVCFPPSACFPPTDSGPYLLPAL